ncbi:hypothetical protein WT60_25890 [Burkholderia sp. MSMB617WGS]|nr:hypothetical protein WT60_25890 [Burkholderia sp. MSMB617WGS]
MRRLIEMRRDIQIVEAGIAFDDRRDKQAVRASVDIFEPAQNFDRAAGHVDALILVPDARHADKRTEARGARH